jgi:hypothetical protein
MSIYLPFGFAMFQIANTQFLHVASRQKQFAHSESMSEKEYMQREEAGSRGDNYLKKFLRGTQRINRIDRTIFYVGLALVVQVCRLSYVPHSAETASYFSPSWSTLVRGSFTLALVCGTGQ